MNNIRKNLITLILTASFTLAASLTAGATSAYASRSVLSEGRWLKVHVDSSSVYRLDYETLRSWGFTNPENVTVHGYGSVEQAHLLDTAPDDLPQVPSTRIGDAIYFYGEGDRRITLDGERSLTYIDNYYSNGSNYFITDSYGSRLEIPETEFSQSATAEDTHIHAELRTPRYLNRHMAGVYFYSPNFANSLDGYDCRYDVTDYVEGGMVAYRYIFHHAEDELQFLHMEFTGDVTPGGYTLGGMKKNNVEHLLYSRSILKEISVTPTSDRGFGMHFSVRKGCKFNLLALAEMRFFYRRKNIVRNDMLKLRYAPGKSSRTVRIFETSPQLAVWDISAPRSPYAPAVSRDGDGNALVSIEGASDAPQSLCAFIPGKSIPEPVLVGEVECRNLHALPSADYLIVTTETLREEAERLAAAHRESQGLTVAVVTQNEVFNEFSSGSAHPNGLRKFVRMLSRRQDKPLRYLLLFGASTYDPRGFSLNDGIEYLTGYETERIDQARYASNDYATDLYFGLEADVIPDNLASLTDKIRIGIGRAPVMSVSEAKDVVDKSIAYLNDTKLAGRPDFAMLCCCFGNEDGHFKASERVYDAIAGNVPSATMARVYEALYPKTPSGTILTNSAFASNLGRSPFLVNYTGHSGKKQLASGMISASSEKNLRYSSMPVLFIAGCENTPIDNADRGIGCQFFLNPQGPIAVIGSGREVYMSNNHRLNEEFARRLTEVNDATPRLGDVWRETINTVSTTSTQRTNNFCFNFLADPALPVRRPDRGIRIESFDGFNASSQEPMSAAYLSPVTLEGVITDSEGRTDTSFNGTISLTIFDAPRKVTRYRHDSSDTTGEIMIDEAPLIEHMAEVNNGRWTAGFTIPVPAHSGQHRLTMLAYGDNGNIAIGNAGKITIEEPAPGNSTEDKDAPEINLYLESESMTDGDEVSATPLLYARISDFGSGLDNNLASIGGSVRLVLDGVTSLSSDASRLLRPESDNKASLTYRLPKLTDGKHTLSLTARDVAGNSTTQTISFVVVSTPIDASLVADSRIVRESVSLNLKHNLSVQPEARIVIRDMLGNTVHSAKATAFPYDFDLRDNSGQALPDGRYRVSAILNNGSRFGATPEIEFVIAKPTEY